MIIVLIRGIAVGIVGAGRCGESGRQLERNIMTTLVLGTLIDGDEIGDGEEGNIR